MHEIAQFIGSLGTTTVEVQFPKIEIGSITRANYKTRAIVVAMQLSFRLCVTRAPNRGVTWTSPDMSQVEAGGQRFKQSQLNSGIDFPSLLPSLRFPGSLTAIFLTISRCLLASSALCSKTSLDS